MKIDEVKTIKLPTTVHDLALAPDCKRLWVACLDGCVRGLDLETEEHFLLGEHSRYASGVHALPDGKTVISAGYDGALLWHDVETRSCFRRIFAHEFWSWQSALSPDGRWLASSTGQYLCGGYKYEPAPEREPSVKVFDTMTGELKASFEHVPPVQSITFSRDGRYVAAGNLMGEIRVWEVETQSLVSTWTTGDFTGWGIIKGHYYTGGVFSLSFGPGDDLLYLVGMGTTRDPAAGNGKQLWQAYAWQEDGFPKMAESSADDTGQGLMESFVFHPSDEWFLMAGRLESGQWNAAAFDRETGNLRASYNYKGRVCQGAFLPNGDRYVLGGGVSQGELKEGSFRDYGRVWVSRAS